MTMRKRGMSNSQEKRGTATLKVSRKI